MKKKRDPIEPKKFDVTTRAVGRRKINVDSPIRPFRPLLQALTTRPEPGAIRASRRADSPDRARGPRRCTRRRAHHRHRDHDP